ncbi:MAG: N-formylglutamate deformylase [Gemmatimonadaceae bacterium]|nr:N-formylglutamate deformylase [Gemmatimonadaceae bacterium]
MSAATVVPDTHVLHRGNTALLLSFPHVGTVIPADQVHRYTERALGVEDTDWFLDRLYDFARERGATLIVPRYSRYLIDLNRSSDNAPMYPGRNNTELCPTRHFTGDALYREGCAPDAAEVARRIAAYWAPYHGALQVELDHIRGVHGHAVLFDAHSILSEVPWLFEGRLPNMSVGTADGASCAPSLREALGHVFASQAAFSHVLDGRFKGGHITRHYGRPDDGVHAVQLEMALRSYMHETQPYTWNSTLATGVTPLLRNVVDTMLAWRP